VLGRIGGWCHDRRRLVVVAWILVMFIGNGVAGSIGDEYRQDFSLEGFESTDGFGLVETEFADGSGSPQTGQIVFKAEQGVRDPAVRSAMEGLFAKVAEIDEVTGIQSPYGPGGDFQISSKGERPGTIAFANVNLPEDIDFTTASDIGKEIRDMVPDVDGVQIELGGFLFAEFEQPSAELFGLAFAVVILIIAFGSVLAMGLPVGVALFGIGLGGAFVILFSHLIEVPDFAPFVGLMIGLGVGIDYALLVVTRYREQLHAGHSIRESITIALDTAGAG
jgi:putative drug exporter of the RND superfamily